ncbi:TetR/AcrR family transcriptional regulator [Brachybacterium kimchii]|uniref:TetR family transcriptional regulator n=1 Tax=Brachybacterium kimchii TaxID=2942909 RepID=A0ABY4N9C6_9MICO|nr:hypothetical protein [Brachybacterium kimchii]UQN31138.1 hypothetical protein M4486_07615 [Brachybacterium kimchii]
MARPVVPILSPSKIADAALELVERSGDVQMTSLAKFLGVAPSSLYSHVQGREEVIDLARLRMLERIAPLPDGLGWEAAVEGLMRQLADHYSRHVKLLPLIFSTSISRERTIAIYEPVFAALLDGGFRPDQLRLIIGLIESQALGLAQGLPEPVISERIRAALPAYTASIDHSRYDKEAATDFAVTVILGGLARMLPRSGE